MKKLLLAALSIVLSLTLTACSFFDLFQGELIGRIITYEDFLNEFTKRVNLDEYDLEYNKYTSTNDYIYTSKTDCEIKSNKSNFQVVADGIKFTLPLTVQEFVDLGFDLRYFDTKKNVNSNTKKNTCILEVITPEGNTFEIFAVSKNNSSVPIRDLIIMQVSCSFYDGNYQYGKGERDNSPKISFFKNVNEKATVDSIIRELKTPRVINFAETKYNGETTITHLQLSFNFSNDDYDGSMTVTMHPVKDKKIERTSYVFSYSYLIDYDSIVDD